MYRPGRSGCSGQRVEDTCTTWYCIVGSRYCGDTPGFTPQWHKEMFAHMCPRTQYLRLSCIQLLYHGLYTHGLLQRCRSGLARHTAQRTRTSSSVQTSSVGAEAAPSEPGPLEQHREFETADSRRLEQAYCRCTTQQAAATTHAAEPLATPDTYTSLLPGETGGSRHMWGVSPVGRRAVPPFHHIARRAHDRHQPPCLTQRRITELRGLSQSRECPSIGSLSTGRPHLALSPPRRAHASDALI